MKDVPGVIQLLSNAFSSGSVSPFASAFAVTSAASFAVLKRRERCWFIFARGATPSTAMKNSFFGLTLRKSWSTYAKMAVKICASERRKCASASLGCEQLWMMPLKSRYKLSVGSKGGEKGGGKRGEGGRDRIRGCWCR
jgi:hypothetical protein